MDEPPKKWHRLSPGREVRLRGACLITCTDVVRDSASGRPVELRCTWDPESRGGTAVDGRRVRGTLHWVSAHHAAAATVRLYDRLFTCENPVDGEDFTAHLNPNSIELLDTSMLEPSLADTEVGGRRAVRTARVFLPR